MKFKKLTAVMAAVALAAGLAACGSGGDDKSGGGASGGGSDSQSGSDANGDSDEGSGDVIEIKLPTYKAGENVGAVFFLPQVERFNKLYEGKYKITIEEVPQAGYADKIKQLAQQNKLPALVHAPGSGGIDAQWFKQVVLENDMAYDLNKLVEAYPDECKNWIPDSKEFCTVDGKLICKPLSVLKPVGLYYNSTMYSADKDIRDMSVDEFIESLGDNKLAFQTAENGWTTALMLTDLIANEEGGVELLADNAADKLWDYNNPIFINAVTKLQKMLQENASSNTVGAAYADAANAFMSKSAAIICNGSWMAAEFTEGSADKWSNDFKGSDVKATIYPGNVAIANPKMYGDFWVANNVSDEEKEVALAFLAFTDTQEEIEALLLAEGGTAPQITYSDNYQTELKKDPILYDLSESMNEETTYCPGLGDVFPSSVADTEFGKLLPKLIDNTLSPEEFCQELTKKAEEAKQ